LPAGQGEGQKEEDEEEGEEEAVEVEGVEHGCLRWKPAVRFLGGYGR
jgi:hypothetical protein